MVLDTVSREQSMFLILCCLQVLFYSSPASPICSTLLSVLALFPGKMLNWWLNEDLWNWAVQFAIHCSFYDHNAAVNFHRYDRVRTLRVGQLPTKEAAYARHWKSRLLTVTSVKTIWKCTTRILVLVQVTWVVLPIQQTMYHVWRWIPARQHSFNLMLVNVPSHLRGKPPSGSELVSQACDVPVNVDSITQIQRVQSKDGLQNDEVILEDSKRTADKTDPLQFLEDITQVQVVQKPSSSSSLADVVSPELPTEGNMEGSARYWWVF